MRTKNDGYRALAAAILLQAAKDAEVVRKRRVCAACGAKAKGSLTCKKCNETAFEIRYIHQFADDLEEWVESVKCRTLCDGLGLSHRKYRNGILRILDSSPIEQ